MTESLSSIRKRAWATRRQKYGQRGHAGSYARWDPYPVNVQAMLNLIIKLHTEGVLSEGQVAKATGLYRIDIRRKADAMVMTTPPKPDRSE